jgi:hypothetical protein
MVPAPRTATLWILFESVLQYESSRLLADGEKALGKFIYHPVILASVHDDDLGDAATSPRSIDGDECDRKPASATAESARVSKIGRCCRQNCSNFSGPANDARGCSAGPYPFRIIRLPCVQEPVGGGRGEHIVRADGRGRRSGMMFTRSHRAVGKRQEHDHNGPGLTRGQETPPRVM